MKTIFLTAALITLAGGAWAQDRVDMGFDMGVNSLARSGTGAFLDNTQGSITNEAGANQHSYQHNNVIVYDLRDRATEGVSIHLLSEGETNGGAWAESSGQGFAGAYARGRAWGRGFADADGTHGW